nr:hypothetical protein Hi04_10k_c3826_00027 [uncultured bacterium]
MKIGLLIITALLTPSAVLAHHSNAAFDGDKVIVLKGTVTQWKWTNPHVWIFLSVDDGKGGKVDWERTPTCRSLNLRVEGSTPSRLTNSCFESWLIRAGFSHAAPLFELANVVDSLPAHHSFQST